MDNLGDRVSHEIRIANKVSNVTEGLANGRDVHEDRIRLRDDLIAYRDKYGSIPLLICDTLPQLGVYLN